MFFGLPIPQQLFKAKVDLFVFPFKPECLVFSHDLVENAPLASNLSYLGPGELVGQGPSRGERGLGVSVSYTFKGVVRKIMTP